MQNGDVYLKQMLVQTGLGRDSWKPAAVVMPIVLFISTSSVFNYTYIIAYE